MPELPEVETVKLGLSPVMSGQKIVFCEQRRLNLRWQLPENMAERISGCRVISLERRSKYLLINLDSYETLLVHLGMSGRLLVLNDYSHTTTELAKFNHKTHGNGRHDHVIFTMESGKRVIYNDPRRFGAMDLVDTIKLQSHPWIFNLGPEPLGEDFSAVYLFEKFRKRKSTVKSALMDQKIIAGLGNIYVLEALWKAGISPRCKASKLSYRRVQKLANAIIEILNYAIQLGGSSLQDFRNVGGDLGYFQNKLNVYGRETDLCRKEDCSGIIKRIKQLGRSSFYCTKCQR